MPTVTSVYTSGGDALRITPPETPAPAPVNNLEEVDEAINYASDALEAIAALEAFSENKDTNTVSEKLFNIAIENYIHKFSIGTEALIENSDKKEEATQPGKVKKVILYLYAFVVRIFTAIFDFFTTHKDTARKIIPLTKDYIGRSDSLTNSIADQLVIKDRSLMVSLHIDGGVPKKLLELYDNLASTFEEQYKHSALNEVVAVVQAAKAKDVVRTKKEAEVLRAKLLGGLESSLQPADASDMSLFQEQKATDKQYFVSKALFGQNYITAVVGDSVFDNGTFSYRCSIRRDPDVALRVASFPVLTPDEIRGVSRVSLKIAENVIRYSRDEQLLKKALREASFIKNQESNESSVAALKDIALLGQSSYIVYLRYTVGIMQSLMRWCGLSLKQYEQLKEKANG